MSIVNFQEIVEANSSGGDQDEFELFARDFLEALGFHVIEGPGRGADRGRDLIVTETVTGTISAEEKKWVVSAKHKAHSGKSVTDIDEPDPIGRVRKFKAHGFMGFYSTLPSGGLDDTFARIRSDVDVFVFDRGRIETRLLSYESLTRVFQQYFPKSYRKWTRGTVWQSLEDTQKELNDLDTHYRPQISLTESGTIITIAEKFPGAAEEKPLAIKTQFDFPNTPEGQAAMDELKRHIATGAPVSVPGEFVKIDVPEFAKPLFGEKFQELGTLDILPVEGPRKHIVRLEFHPDGEEPYIVEHVELNLVQGGNEEFTFTNDKQQTLFRMELVVRPGDGAVTVNTSYESGAMNVHQLLSKLKFGSCISKPVTARIIDVNLNICLFEIRTPPKMDAAPNPQLLEAVSDLAAIQTKVRRPIIWPDADLTDDEIEAIRTLQTILHTGHIQGTWKDMAVSLPPTGIERLLELTVDSPYGKPVKLTMQEIQSLFGSELPLGDVELVLESAIVANEQELRDQLATVNLIDEVGIEVKLVPGHSNKVIKTYMDWQPKSKLLVDGTQSNRKRQHPNQFPSSRNPSEGKRRKRRRQ